MTDHKSKWRNAAELSSRQANDTYTLPRYGYKTRDSVSQPKQEP